MSEMKNVSEKLDEYFGLQGDIAGIEEQLKERKKELDKVQEDLIETMEASGLTQLKDSQGRTVYLKSPTVYASFNKERKDEALEYLKSEWELGDLIKQTVSPATLSKVVKEKLEQGDTVPSDLFGYYLKKKLGYRS